MKLVLLGPPGAGKGTLAKGLIDALKVEHVSTGDILREQLKNETELGLEAKKHMEKAAKELDFIEAARFRDEMYAYQELLTKIEKAPGVP